MSVVRRGGRRVVSGFAAVALAFGMAALGASAASAAPAVDIAPVPGSPLFPGEKIEYNGVLYFVAEDESANAVLYSLNGSTITEVTGGDPAPTDVQLGPVFGDKLYFSGFNGTERYVYTWDGTTIEEVPGSPIGGSDFVIFGGELLFVGWNGSEFVWFSWDGVAFTELSSGFALLQPYDPVVYDGTLYFIGYNGTTYVLFSWDGTTFEEVSGGGDPAPTEVGTPYVHDGVLYLTAYDGVDEILYTWDGTDFTDLSGVAPLYPSRFFTFGADLYFRADDGTDNFLFRFDGTTYTKVVGAAGGVPAPDDPEHFVVYNGVIYFNADGEGPSSNTLFSWDGTAFTGYPAPPFDMEDPIVYNGVLYFSAEPTDTDEDVEVLYSLRASAPAPELAATGVELALPLGLAGAAVIAGVAAIATALVTPPTAAGRGAPTGLRRAGPTARG